MGRSPWVAIEATTDRRQRARELIEAHRLAMGGDEQRGNDVRDVIRGSWNRSAAAGVSPAVDSAPIRFSEEDARNILESGPLHVAPPVLRQLREDVQAEDEQIALLCDPSGTILWIEGDPRVLDRARGINLAAGAEWSEAAVGTNAMGTALALDHPVQIFSAEHFAEPVHEWTCAAAPIHDPETGECIGVIDLSGGLTTAHPHSLALVSSAARVIESKVLYGHIASEARIRKRFGEVIDAGRAAALVTGRGKVIAAANARLEGERVVIPDGGGPVSLGGRRLVAEPADDLGAFLLVPAPASSRRPARVSTLGVDRISIAKGRRSKSLSKRHSEIVLTLLLRPGGMSAEKLTLEVWGESAKPITARAELSRLRRILGTQLEAKPYRLEGEYEIDMDQVRELLGSGLIGEALDAYAGPVLPNSEVPVVEEARRLLDDDVRGALVARADPTLLERWLEHPCGRDDAAACKELVAMLPDGDPRRADALAHLRRITASQNR